MGLVALALGAHKAGPAPGIASWRECGLGALVFSIVGGFFALVVGGWVAGKVSEWRRTEPAILHGAIAWLVAVPMLVVLVALGTVNMLSGWYGGLAGVPVWALRRGDARGARC
jgi:hypothetical protein